LVLFPWPSCPRKKYNLTKFLILKRGIGAMLSPRAWLICFQGITSKEVALPYVFRMLHNVWKIGKNKLYNEWKFKKKSCMGLGSLGWS
jgi:hypothetical protein